MKARKSTKPLKTGEAINLYAVALVTAAASLVMLLTCWPAAIPFLLLTASIVLWAWFRSPTLIVTAESLTVSQPRRGVNAVYPWSRYRCLYRLEGVWYSLAVLSPQALTKDELRALVRAHESHRGVSCEINGCLVLSDGRSPAGLLVHIPESVRRMPYSDCISL